jgi:DNA uptake protein ComE-like DNA-binding protein
MHFDPNTIDSSQAIYLGIPFKQVNALLHYRQKGGRFNTKEAFAKLYGLSPELYDQLLPYIQIKSNAVQWQANWHSITHDKTNFKNFQPANKEEPVWKLEINTADEKEWGVKSGLPPPIVKSILAYRNYLGAFTKINQVAKVYGMPDSLYQVIRPHLTLKLDHSPLLNAAAMRFADWKALGIFSDKQVSTILQLTHQNGKIGWEELVTIGDLTQEEANGLRRKIHLSD